MTSKNEEQYIKIAADSIAELRKVDVYRVLDSVRADNIDGVTRSDIASFIVQQRPELGDEVAEVMSEEFPSESWSLDVAKVRNLPEAQGEASRLWIALVDHQEVPGTRVVLFSQPKEPTDDAILGRFRSECDVSELKVVGTFDLTHAVDTDPDSLAAVKAYAQQFVTPPTVVAEQASAVKLPRFMETYVPWGANRSPLGR